MDNLATSAFQTFTLNIGGLIIKPNYIQAFFVVLLIFLLVFSMSHMHHMFIKWSFKGSIVGLVIGFVLALVVEGFFVISGTTILTSVLGIKNAPKPVAKALQDSRAKLQTVVCEPQSQQEE